MAEATQPTAHALPKGEFAKLIGVSPGRVSQMISEGKITPDAIEGEGRSARIVVSLAREQLRLRTDIGQRFGNGSATNLENLDKSPTLNDGGAAFGANSIDAKLRLEKLREVEFRNRAAAQKELLAQGEYVRTEDVQAAVAGMAGAMVTVFEGALADMSKALSAKFELSDRDVLHLLRTEFTAARERASEALAKAAERLPAVITHERDGD